LLAGVNPGGGDAAVQPERFRRKSNLNPKYRGTVHPNSNATHRKMNMGFAIAGGSLSKIRAIIPSRVSLKIACLMIKFASIASQARPKVTSRNNRILKV
jgi:hypothetical protein